MADHHKEIDYNYITDGIYIGTNQCCETHFAEKLLKEGVSADISFEEKREEKKYMFTARMATAGQIRSLPLIL